MLRSVVFSLQPGGVTDLPSTTAQHVTALTVTTLFTELPDPAQNHDNRILNMNNSF